MSGAKKKAARKALEAQQPKKKVYTLTEEEIQRMKRDAVDEAMNKAYVLMLSIPCMVLRDKFGFGSTRMSRFAEEAIEYYRGFHEGYFTLDDCIKTLNEETEVSVTEIAKEKRLF